MPTGKRGGKGRKSHRKTKPEGPLSDCKLPNDVILNILSRLPVKTLLRFTSVCQPFKTLIRSPKFIALHLTRNHSSAAAATTPSLLLHSVHQPTLDNRLSLFSLQPFPSLASSRAFVEPSLPKASLEMDVVGTHNGVVCLSQPPLGYRVSILNPTTKQYLPITTPAKLDPIIHERVSIGFGFDPVTDNHKVISIYSAKDWVNVQSGLFVYNCELGDWKRVEIQGPLVSVMSTKCEVVINGVPYWTGSIVDDHGSRRVLLWFDMNKEVFCHISMPINSGTLVPVDWKGNFAMLMYPKDEDFEYVDVLVIEDNGDGIEWWNIKYRLGPFSVFKYVLGCSRGGHIVGEDGEGNLLLYDSETGRIEHFGVDGKVERKFHVFNYRESLVSFKGERPITRLLTSKELFGKDKKGIGERLKIKFDSYGNMTCHLPIGNGGSVAVKHVNDELVFGQELEDGTFLESESTERLRVPQTKTRCSSNYFGV